MSIEQIIATMEGFANQRTPPGKYRILDWIQALKDERDRADKFELALYRAKDELCPECGHREHHAWRPTTFKTFSPCVYEKYDGTPCLCRFSVFSVLQ